MNNVLPYPLYAIQQKIEEEQSFIGKYFFLVDLFNALVKYVLVLLISYSNKKIELKNKYNDIDNLKLVINKINTNKISFKIPELIELKDVWLEIQKFEKIKNKEITKDFEKDIYYKNEYEKLNSIINNIILKLTFLTKYELITPYQKENSKLKFISLAGNIKIRNIKLTKNISNLNLNSLYLKIEKSFFELNTSLFTKSFKSNENELLNLHFDNILNSFISFILGSDYLKLSFNITDKKNKYDIFENYIIERPQVNNFLNKFLNSKKSGYLFIIGCYGAGKTTALQSFIKENKEKNFFTTNIIKNKSFYSNITQIIKDINKNINCDNKTMIVKNFIKSLDELDKNKSNIILFEDISLIPNFNDFISLFPEELPENVYILFTMSARESITIPKLKESELYYLPVLGSNEAENMYKLILNQKEVHTEKVFNIIKRTLGLPLYTKLAMFESLDLVSSDYDKKIKKLKSLFRENYIDIVNYTVKNFPDFKDNVRTFLGYIAISGEGLTKPELKALSNLPFDLSEFVIDQIGAFLIKINGKYKFSNNLF
ncbi:MAG: NB-ARC domain-containing protein, partial [Candidatus Sericytochromatia bacterium]